MTLSDEEKKAIDCDSKTQFRLFAHEASETDPSIDLVPPYSVGETFMVLGKTYQILTIWIERLREISDDDCVKEGALYCDDGHTWVHFYEVWNSTHPLGPKSWDFNPWVWVCTFERVKG